MFQLYAITYKVPGNAQGFGTTCVVDLDEAYQMGMEEMGEARRALIRRMIAIRHLGNMSRAHDVELTEVVRLGQPTAMPGA